MIRYASEKDFPSIYNFINELEQTNFEYEKQIRIYDDNLLNDSIIYLIAEAGTVSIGFLSCYINSLLHHGTDVAEIQELYICQEWRSRGFGKRMLSFLVNDLKSKGIMRLEVTSNLARKETHLFYENFGFSCTSKKFVLNIK